MDTVWEGWPGPWEPAQGKERQNTARNPWFTDLSRAGHFHSLGFKSSAVEKGGGEIGALDFHLPALGSSLYTFSY